MFGSFTAFPDTAWKSQQTKWFDSVGFDKA